MLLIEPDVVEEERGFFLETFHEQRYREIGLTLPFVQDNRSLSRRGVLRGLHYQDPHPQGKLVWVIRGEIYDVAVDLRKRSPTFRRWVSVRLNARRCSTTVYSPRPGPRFLHAQPLGRSNVQDHRLLPSRLRVGDSVG